MVQSAASGWEVADAGLLDEDLSPRSEGSLGITVGGRGREAVSEDNELYPEDGVQESPSHHKQRFDLEGGHRGYEVPSQMDVELLNYKDVEYIGEVFLGAPHSQRATVVIDTGSSWLNIKACLDPAHCHVHSYEKKGTKEKKPGYLKDYRKTVLRDPTDTHNGIVYYTNKTKSGEETNKAANFTLAYGSANLQGWRYQDYTCLRALPDDLQSLDDLTQEMLDVRYCVKDIRFMTITESKGMDTCDGILGISPKNYARHSFLQELKIAGLIDHGIISFSNAYDPKSFQGKEFSHDVRSYATFGGINATQIVGGEQGLASMPLVRGKMNPTFFWGVKARGMAYGKTVLMDPDTEPPLLGVIDSGTTLAIIPTVMFENLVHTMAEKFHHDPLIDMVCVRVNDTGIVDHCYFNNTKCSPLMAKHGDKFGNFEF